MIEQLESLLSSLAELQESIRKNKSAFVSRSALKDSAKATCKQWLGRISTQIRSEESVSDQTLNEIDQQFEKILDLANGNNRKNSYISILRPLLKQIQQEILVPIIKRSNSAANPLLIGILAKIYSLVSSQEEKDYFEESARAASTNCHKAATVMAWCASIDRLRKVVESHGLKSFNKMSKKLKAKTTGYYKSFSRDFNLTQTNELQEVSDRDLIIVLSGIVNLDLNEIKAILHLAEVRNHCAHPSSYVMDELAYTNYLNETLKLLLTNPKLH